jgi:hypothetical protein
LDRFGQVVQLQVGVGDGRPGLLFAGQASHPRHAVGTPQFDLQLTHLRVHRINDPVQRVDFLLQALDDPRRATELFDRFS